LSDAAFRPRQDKRRLKTGRRIFMPKQDEAAYRDPPTDRRTSSELARLVQKLRWMGREEDAKPLMEELKRRGAPDAASVITASRETD
jgi:hypothetical protein